jgi:hypothetical protein
MKFEIGAMSVGDILDRGLRLLLARLPIFYAINLLVMWPLLLLQLLLPTFVTGELGNTQFLELLAGLFGVLLLSIVLSPFGAAAMLHVVAKEFVDQRVGVGSAFAFAFRHSVSLLVVSLLYGVMVEGRGPIQAFQRSQQLTRGFRGRLFGLFLILAALLVASMGVQTVLGQVLPGIVPSWKEGSLVAELYSYPNHVIHTLIGFLLQTLVQTYYNICITLFYFDVRIRKEGYDLELAAGQQPSVSS